MLSEAGQEVTEDDAEPLDAETSRPRFHFPILSGFGSRTPETPYEGSPLLDVPPAHPFFSRFRLPTFHRTTEDDTETATDAEESTDTTEPTVKRLVREDRLPLICMAVVLVAFVIVTALLVTGYLPVQHNESGPAGFGVNGTRNGSTGPNTTGPSSSSGGQSILDYLASTTITPPDIRYGYSGQPSPQLPTAGLTPSSIPAQFAINQTGLFVPQGWGGHWAAAQQSGSPAEIAIIGDAYPWQGALDVAILNRFNAPLGTGRECLRD